MIVFDVLLTQWKLCLKKIRILLLKKQTQNCSTLQRIEDHINHFYLKCKNFKWNTAALEAASDVKIMCSRFQLNATTVNHSQYVARFRRSFCNYVYIGVLEELEIIATITSWKLGSAGKHLTPPFKICTMIKKKLDYSWISTAYFIRLYHNFFNKK